MRISDWSSDVCSSDLTGTTDLECFSERLRGLRGLVLGNTQLTPVPHEGGVKISGFGQSVPRGVRDAFYIGLCLPEVTTLGRGELQLCREILGFIRQRQIGFSGRAYRDDAQRRREAAQGRGHAPWDRKSVVAGNRVDVRVGLGGARIL